MRICFVVHGFPPIERTGVENYTESLARALSRAGHEVEVFVPRRSQHHAHLSVRREQRAGYVVQWVTLNQDPRGPAEELSRPDLGQVFGDYLDRERPQLLHFQHVIKLGIALVFEAKKRKIPMAYTAHDYYSICHRYTLLRPDLEPCSIRGDSASCSRCDAALGFLNTVEGLGDYQMGVFPDQLSPEDAQRLGAILDEDVERSGLSQAEFDALFDQRFELDGLRAQAFAAIDRIVAPTQFLADELVGGGIEREKIEVLPYGIENEDLVRLPPVVRRAGQPLRFAFFGGLSKHKGVQVLIEAVGEGLPGAEVSIWGYSSDEVHVAELRRGAERAGIAWRGPYEREELAGFLAQTDVVVVPSTWVENYPIVIREAFSAGRPVITSRFGAMPESVRDGIDGLLFERGDAQDLARAMARLIQEEGLLEKLAGGIEPVKSIDEQAAELEQLYSRLWEARVRVDTGDLPESVRGFAAAYHSLDERPNRELFTRAFERLKELGNGLGIARPSNLLVEALASGASTKETLRDARRALSSLREENAWLRETLESRDKEVAWLREHKEHQEREAREEIERLKETISESRLASLEQEVGELQDLLGESEASVRSVADLGRVALQVQEKMLMQEILWRRGEMNQAKLEAERKWVRSVLQRMGIGRRIAAWESAPVAEEDAS